jgi:hypothetical protein
MSLYSEGCPICGPRLPCDCRAKPTVAQIDAADACQSGEGNATSPQGQAAATSQCATHQFWCRSRKAGRIDNNMLICDCKTSGDVAMSSETPTPSADCTCYTCGWCKASPSPDIRDAERYRAWSEAIERLLYELDNTKLHHTKNTPASRCPVCVAADKLRGAMLAIDTAIAKENL